VYRLAELVVDVPSLIQRLAELAGDSLLAGQTSNRCLRMSAGRPAGRRPEIRAQRIVSAPAAPPSC
jgi:hypothetical protein